MEDDAWSVKETSDGVTVELTRLHGRSAGLWSFEHFKVDGRPRVIRVEHKRTSPLLLVCEEFPDDLDDDALAHAIGELVDLKSARDAVRRLRPTDGTSPSGQA